MARKSLDRQFLHYGIRQEDMQTIEELCTTHELDFEWIKENILKAYHEKKVEKLELSDIDTGRVINAAINQLK